MLRMLTLVAFSLATKFDDARDDPDRQHDHHSEHGQNYEDAELIHDGFRCV